MKNSFANQFFPNQFIQIVFQMAHQPQGLPFAAVSQGNKGNQHNNYPLGQAPANPQDHQRRNPRQPAGAGRRPRPHQPHGSFTRSADRIVINRNVVESITSTTYIDENNKKRKVVEVQRDDNTRIVKEKLKTGRKCP